MAGNLLGLGLFLIGCVLILVNGAAVYKTLQNRRRGIERFVSGVFLMPQLLMIGAALGFNHAGPPPWLPAWLPLAVAALDPGLWRLLHMAAKVARDKPGRRAG